MEILLVNGSAKADSSNQKLLNAIALKFTKYNFTFADYLKNIPLFYDGQQNSENNYVKKWKHDLSNSDAVIISTPEYIHNMPALLKNAFEWIAASGELVSKKVIAISFTPNAPRGEKSLQSLLWTLSALDSNILASLSLYKNETTFDSTGDFIHNPHFDTIKMLDEVMLLL